MTFSSLMQLFDKYFGGETSNAGDFLMMLVDNFMEDPTTNADKEKAEKEKYNPFAGLQSDTLRGYVNGKRPLPQKHAKAIRGKLDRAKFADFVYSFSSNALSSLCKELMSHGIKTKENTVGEDCADLFEQVIDSCTKSQKLPANLGMEAGTYVEPESFGVSDIPLETVYIKDGLLHVGNDVIKLSERLTVPPDIDNREHGYIPKLYEAYSDAENTEITHDALHAYPKYKNNFSEQRMNFFNALYVIEVVRGKFAKNEWLEQLSILKSEIHSGISDVYYGDYDHGYARLVAVLIQANNTPINKSSLAKIRNFIGVSEKKGMCHILVGEGKIKSWVNVYDE